MQFSKTITSGASACGADGTRYPACNGSAWSSADRFAQRPTWDYYFLKEVLSPNFAFFPRGGAGGGAAAASAAAAAAAGGGGVGVGGGGCASAREKKEIVSSWIMLI